MTGPAFGPRLFLADLLDEGLQRGERGFLVTYRPAASETQRRRPNETEKPEDQEDVCRCRQGRGLAAQARKAEDETDDHP